jgi:LmbE family N-acetylglucosaminyl deacetylase
VFGNKNILMIGAHHDDIELGCGGTCKKLVENGNSVSWLVCTKATYKNIDGDVQRTHSVAHHETMKSAEILGVNNFHQLEYEATKLSHNVDLIISIEKVINEVNPDLIFTHWTKDVHQDHRAVALSTLTASRKISSVVSYQSNWYIPDGVFDGRLFVDITNQMDAKKESILAHKSEVNKFGPEWLNFVIGRNMASGQVYGCKYAENFELIKMDLF